MMRLRSFLLVACATVFFSPSAAQGRKLPAISFAEGTTNFANANRNFNDQNQYTDTLRDSVIVKSLVGIMHQNQGLLIEINGHSSMGEDTALAAARAHLVAEMLVTSGVARERLTVKGYGRRQPIISDELLFSLSSRAERDAASQKNRRVEIKVIGNNKPEP